ncbi:hypothetical protein SY27_01745 [Flavobacterium sp. 316]|uniref:hypothetical protein n=1 Tax=Flavobacterium sp. 316 TaxID=1603293 RepID=UPI0005E5B7D2|nr:hypothetical protein [Flavobacterium sp. 316]KIX22581.1 hypothetical protein SY27_01745 [Flavobacterium sp. 316]
MTKFLYVVLFFAFGLFALYEQSQPEPNKFLMIGSLVIFMVGLYKIMNKIPSKNDSEDDE